MIKIRKHTNFWVPRDAVQYFREHTDLWQKLDSGEIVEIPKAIYEIIKKRVEIVNEEKTASPKPLIIKQNKKSSSNEDSDKEIN